MKSQHTDLHNPKPFDSPPGFQEISALPNLGNYHSPDTLSKLSGDSAATMSVKELSQYADYVARGSYNQLWFIKQIKNTIHSRKLFIYKLSMEFQITCFGNIAWIATHSKDPKLKSICEQFILKCQSIKIKKRIII